MAVGFKVASLVLMRLFVSVEGRKMVKGDLEASLAVKRREGLQLRRKWFNEDNPQPDDDEEESDAELTDNDENDGSDQLDAGDDAASLTVWTFLLQLVKVE